MKFLMTMFVLGAIVTAWSPWLSKEEAQKILDDKIVEIERSTPNLCALTIYRDTLHKVPFGYAENVSFDCTVTDDVYGVKQTSDTVLVTFYKGILGLPSPTVRRSP